jgi:phospho-N-acetylmuramoyl-pentapeptide-transferase
VSATTVALVAALASWLATGAFLAMARTRGWGKSVRLDGPSGHLVKEGTPTMGGAGFLAAALATTAVALALGGSGGGAAGAFNELRLPGATGPAPADAVGAGAWALLALVAVSGALGLWDDLASLGRKRRLADGEDASTGLLARWRLLGQGAAALAFAAWAVANGRELFGTPWLDVPGLAFVVVGTVNALNMTDGLDGLAGGSAAVMLLAFWGDPFAAALLGALLGFLWFNAHPARLFMGGVGSEALGAAIAGLAILHGDVWRLPILAFVPMAEVLSVMAQVSWFRATGGRRLLKMAPLHHHFELSGWPETRVATRFWIVTALLAVVTVASRAWW